MSADDTWVRRVWFRLLAVLLVGAGAFVPLAPAQAQSAGQADARVRAILARVAHLQEQITRTEKKYDAALGGLAASVTQHISAVDQANQFAHVQAARRQRFVQGVRDLYMSGGSLAAYASLLGASSPTDLQVQATVARAVVTNERNLLRAGVAVTAQANQIAVQKNEAVVTAVQTERSVAQVANRLFRMLAQEQQLLAHARVLAAHLHAVEAAQAQLAAALAGASSVTAARLAQLSVLPASAEYMKLYHSAASAQCPGLSWTVLAAIGQVESGHGRNVSTSYAGAMGPMQFLPSTFAAYAVDGDGDGVANIMDPADAIYTAAHYLCANGASSQTGLYGAVFHYNHADWYVQMVLKLAGMYAGGS